MTGDEPGQARRHGVALVIGDEPQFVELLCEILTDAGITVTGCTTPEAAFTLVRRRTPQLVILDLAIPHLAGFEFLRQFRAAPEMVSLPVLVITASAKEILEHLPADAHGSVDVLAKPFDLDELLETVERMLSAY